MISKLTCYMDNNATTVPHKTVVNCLEKVLLNLYANPSSSHAPGRAARKRIEESRCVIAKFLHVKPKEIYFTSGATEANNLAMVGCWYSCKNKNKKGKLHVITSAIEHASVLNTCKDLEKRHNCEVTYIGVDKYGRINPRDVINAIKPNTILVSLMLANNVIGTRQDACVKYVGEYLRKHRTDIHYHCDATQMAGKYKIDCQELGVDSLCGSGHKFHALKGCGFLFLKEGAGVEHCVAGGKQEFGLRPGTESIHSAVSMAVAMARNLDRKRYTNIHEKLRKMRDYMQSALMKSIPGIKINGDLSKNGRLVNTLSICLPGIDSRKFLKKLDKHGVCMNVGSACSLQKRDHVLLACGVSEQMEDGTLRISLSEYNTMKQCKYVIETLVKLYNKN